MKQQKYIAALYEVRAYATMLAKLIEQRDAGEISHDSFSAKIRGLKKRIEASRAKHSGE